MTALKRFVLSSYFHLSRATVTCYWHVVPLTTFYFI